MNISEGSAANQSALEEAREAAESHAIATQGTRELALFDMEEDAGLGLTNVGIDDQAIPFLMILQALSPQVKKGPAKIDGAEEGMVFNSLTKELFPASDGAQGIFVVPVAYECSMLEWKPREQGGGFCGKHPMSMADALLATCTKDERGRDVLPNGNHIIRTAQHFVLLLKPDGGYEQAVISMSSTQFKKSKAWNSLKTSKKLPSKNGGSFTPPSFAFVYQLTTVLEQRDANSWFGWSIADVGALLDGSPERAEIYQAAKSFAKAIGEGKVKVAEPGADDAGDDADSPF